MELYDDLRDGLDVADLEEDGSEARKAASLNRGGETRAWPRARLSVERAMPPAGTWSGKLQAWPPSTGCP
jgi:hypothetical protein